MIEPELDPAKTEAFTGKMVGVLNGAILALMTSIGRQTGLFERMAALPPSTSEAIATASGLNERYVREWLGAMVTGGIVAYDAGARTYVLPAEHAAVVAYMLDESGFKLGARPLDAETAKLIKLR